MKKVIPGKIKTQLRLDGYYNVLNKYGTQHDSTEYYQWASGSAVSDTELADLYAGNGLFSTVIDAPADDATKNGIDLGIKDKDLQKQIDNHLQTIRYQSKFAKALRWARLFGGAAVVMLVDDGRLLQNPLNWRDVHGVEELLVYGRGHIPTTLRRRARHASSKDSAGAARRQPASPQQRHQRAAPSAKPWQICSGIGWSASGCRSASASPCP